MQMFRRPYRWMDVKVLFLRAMVSAVTCSNHSEWFLNLSSMFQLSKILLGLPRVSNVINMAADIQFRPSDVDREKVKIEATEIVEQHLRKERDLHPKIIQKMITGYDRLAGEAG